MENIRAQLIKKKKRKANTQTELIKNAVAKEKESKEICTISILKSN